MRILYSTYFWILYSRIQVFRRSNHVGQCLSTPFCKDRIYLNRMSLNTTKTNSISTFNITTLHVEKHSSSWKCIDPNWLQVDFAKFLNVVLLDNGLSWEHHISPLLLSLIVPDPIFISTLLYDFITHVLTTNLFIVLLSGVAATISCYDSFVSRSVLGIYQPFIPATSLRRLFPYSR